MPVSVTMPRLGESVTEGTVTRWLKQEGERVEADEPLLEVSTDKVDTEIPSPAAGVLSRIVVGEDETADVGSELAVIDGDGEDAGSAPAPAQQEQQAAAPAQQPQDSEPEPAAPDAPSTEKPVEDEAPEPQAAAPTGGGEGTAVTMPALGESVTEGTVTRWLKQVGDTVEADEPLLEVSTDKVDTEIPSPVAGTVLEIKVPEDENADVGAELAIIGTPGGAQAGAPAPQQAPAPEQAAPQQAAPRQAAPPQQPQQPTIESAPAPDIAPAGESAGESAGDPAPEAEEAAEPGAAERAA
jgi:pyruvate dehydrogenase E2 component (dihydrolipoamide acetyltransferase)